MLQIQIDPVDPGSRRLVLVVLVLVAGLWVGRDLIRWCRHAAAARQEAKDIVA